MTSQRRLIAESFWIRFGGCWLLIGAIFLASTMAVALSRQDQAFREIAEGVVIAKHHTPSQVFPFIEVEFAPRNGTVRHVRREVPPALWEALDPGSTIHVRYDSRHPEDAEVEGDMGQAFLLLMLGSLGAFLTVMGGWVVSVELARIRQAARRR